MADDFRTVAPFLSGVAGLNKAVRADDLDLRNRVLKAGPTYQIEETTQAELESAVADKGGALCASDPAR